MEQHSNLKRVMEAETIKNAVSPKNYRNRKNAITLFIVIGFASILFISCNYINKSGDEYLTCDKIHPSSSRFSTLNVRIGSTYADYSGYSSLVLAVGRYVDSKWKPFFVAESNKNSKIQTFTLKNVPDEFLENFICDTYSPNGRHYGKNFRLLSWDLLDSELQKLESIKISNANAKIAIILYGSIAIYANGQMGNDDGLITSVNAEMSPDKEKMDCFFRCAHLVYSDSDCDITGYYWDNTIKVEIYLRKGWNKVFDFNDRIITTDDVKDSHLIWFQHAG